MDWGMQMTGKCSLDVVIEKERGRGGGVIDEAKRMGRERERGGR